MKNQNDMIKEVQALLEKGQIGVSPTFCTKVTLR